MRANVALSPMTPQNAAGMRMEPPPSVPMAMGTSPEATAAALPADEPPVWCDTYNSSGRRGKRHHQGGEAFTWSKDDM